MDENNNTGGSNGSNGQLGPIGSDLNAEPAQESQFRKMTNWMLDSGSLSPEEAEKLIQSENITTNLSEGLDKSKPGYLSDQLDQMFPAGKPEEFILPKKLAMMTNDEYKSYDFDMRAWLSIAGFPPSLGSYLAEQINEANEKYQAMNPVDQKLWARNQSSSLRQVFGDEWNLRTGLSVMLSRELDKKHPGFIALLEKGGGYSAMVVAQLAMHAERLLDRKAKN